MRQQGAPGSGKRWQPEECSIQRDSQQQSGFLAVLSRISRTQLSSVFGVEHRATHELTPKHLADSSVVFSPIWHGNGDQDHSAEAREHISV